MRSHPIGPTESLANPPVPDPNPYPIRSWLRWVVGRRNHFKRQSLRDVTARDPRRLDDWKQMPSPPDVERIAGAMHALRPDWRIDSLITFLTKNHGKRPYRDLAIAAIVVATDPKTQTPRLLDNHGPWWKAAQAASGETTTDIHFDRCPEPGHSSYPAHNCGACRTDELEPPAPAAPHTPTTTPAPWLDDIRADIAKAKEKYAHE